VGHWFRMLLPGLGGVGCGVLVWSCIEYFQMCFKGGAKNEELAAFP